EHLHYTTLMATIAPESTPAADAVAKGCLLLFIGGEWAVLRLYQPLVRRTPVAPLDVGDVNPIRQSCQISVCHPPVNRIRAHPRSGSQTQRRQQCGRDRAEGEPSQSVLAGCGVTLNSRTVTVLPKHGPTDGADSMPL